MRACSKCQEIKSFDQFYPKIRPSGKLGYQSYCKSCSLEDRRNYYALNPDKKASTNRKSQLKKYGMTSEDFDTLYREQQGNCAGCGIHQSELARRISVDHNHETGAVRGLLCQACNTAIGLVKEDPAILKKLMDYLDSYKVISIKKTSI